MSTPRSPLFACVAAALAAAAVAGAPSAAHAQKLYKYRDANGVLVLTDRAPAPGQAFEVGTAPRRFEPPEVRLYQRATTSGVGLVAANTFFAPIQLAFKLTQMANVAADTPRDGMLVIGPRSEAELLTVGKAVSNAEMRFEYEFAFLPGDPAAEHRAARPYRLPYALSSAFRVSQAFPDTLTHTDPSSQHAVDFVMPVGTNVFAAREGVVIEVAGENYASGTDATVDGPRANLVRVLHDDGTMSLYGHLNWNTIRVVPGQRVALGEYIADSGNTGFSTGPHLHFVVQRNRGGAIVSVPVEFAGAGGVPVTLRSGERYTAY